MSSNSLKTELANHIYQYLCHEAQHSDLPEAAKESITAASECIEQAYKLNSINISNKNHLLTSDSNAGTNKQKGGEREILPDELFRIFTRHKEVLSQQQQHQHEKHHHHHNQHHKNSHKYSFRNNTDGNESSSMDRPEIRLNQHHRQKNFKQKLIALIKKFRTDGSDFGSEEQYREALERELMKAAAGRGSKAIKELLEEDIDVEEESGASGTEDWDNISESSTPKPSLRPFFSSTTLDKI